MSRFDEWWALYPRKVGKKVCARIWKREKLDDIADQMIDHLKLQIRQQYRWTEKKFIPHPQTYLNQGRWEDEIDWLGTETDAERIARQADEIILDVIDGGKLLK